MSRSKNQKVKFLRVGSLLFVIAGIMTHLLFRCSIDLKVAPFNSARVKSNN